ncbi:iron-containing alcohol dehydrogenase, partial [Actinomycetota bacterium]
MPDDHNSAGNEWDTAFNAGASSVTFGPGCLREAGDVARSLAMTRVALLTDPRLAVTDHFAAVYDSLVAAGLIVAVYEDVQVEPTDKSFLSAAEFAAAARVDGFVSLGGGSVIDTAKAANLYSSHPADLLTYVNAPIGEGAPVPGPLLPHLACPTTSGTGSECTGIAVFDLLEIKTKTGIVSKRIRPTHALVDPNCTLTLPRMVVACTAFDVLSHAL